MSYKTHTMPREELDMTTIIGLARKTRDVDLVKAYATDQLTCEYCGTPRKIVKGKPVRSVSLCTDTCVSERVNELVYSCGNFIIRIATAFAKANRLPNGQTIHYLNDDYRNNNLLFWDDQNRCIVYPFYECDDYGSVPPIFPVGDGYFHPTDWIGEVDHNSFVFPSITLIKEMKEFVAENPTHKKMIVTINGSDYDVLYNPKEMEGEWDSAILEVEPAITEWGHRNFSGNSRLHVGRGRPEWRKDIVE